MMPAVRSARGVPTGTPPAECTRVRGARVRFRFTFALLLLCPFTAGCGDAAVLPSPQPSTSNAPRPAAAAEQPSGPVEVKPELPAGDARLAATWQRDLNLAGIEAQGKLLDDAALDRFAALAAKAQPADIPPARRWEFFLPDGITVADYAEQMEALGMELAVVLDDGQIEYVTKLTQPTPTRRKGTLADEKRPYWSWQRGDLIAADREILARTGLATGDRIILHFWPASVEAKLAQLETAFQNRRPSAIYRTRFGVRAAAGGFEFFVMEQTAR